MRIVRRHFTRSGEVCRVQFYAIDTGWFGEKLYDLTEELRRKCLALQCLRCHLGSPARSGSSVGSGQTTAPLSKTRNAASAH